MSTTAVSIADQIAAMGRAARAAQPAMAAASTAAKNKALARMAELFDRDRATIVAANEKDLAQAKADGLSPAMIDRLRMDSKGIDKLIVAVNEIVALPDPVGEIVGVTTRPNGLRIGQRRSPIGVIGIIYESRPNVTVDAGALCLKSGNASILRGGKEAFATSTALAGCMAQALADAGLPAAGVQMIPTKDREAVGAMLKLDACIDVIIPRGGKDLIRRIVEESTIPVIRHLDGNCSVYVDATADLDMALRIVVNSKTQRTGVCNAAETLLVHRDVAERFLPVAIKALQEKKVEIRGDAAFCAAGSGIVPATEDDWAAEYLDLIIAARVVDSLDDAIAFINKYGSGHTDTIVTTSLPASDAFVTRVDSACVHVNCSTRFSDGGEYGLGAEIGISTNKLHARGPMGLKELTTLKWVVYGEGQVRQ